MKNMLNKAEKILGVILSISVFLFLLTSALHVVSFDMRIYEQAFERYGIAEDLDVDIDTLMVYTDLLTSYLKGEVDSPNLITTVRGVEGPLYGEREILHLVDVRDLFALSFTVRNISMAIALASLALILKARAVSGAARAYMYSSLAIMSLLLLLGILAAVDFERYFTYFHLISFSNDLWLLDPATENLIRLFPEPFFADVALRVAVRTMGLFAGSSLVSFVLVRKSR
jgi:integral membrane protein (TIGR01906 family)